LDTCYTTPDYSVKYEFYIFNSNSHLTYQINLNTLYQQSNISYQEKFRDLAHWDFSNPCLFRRVLHPREI